MSGQSEACRANALRCFEVSEKTRTPEDRCEFLSFAACWERLANEIEHSERLVALLDQLVVNNDVQPEPDELAEHLQSGTRSLRHLAAAIVSVSAHFVSDHFSARAEEFEDSALITPQT